MRSRADILYTTSFILDSDRSSSPPSSSTGRQVPSIPFDQIKIFMKSENAFQEWVILALIPVFFFNMVMSKRFKVDSLWYCFVGGKDSPVALRSDNATIVQLKGKGNSCNGRNSQYLYNTNQGNTTCCSVPTSFDVLS